MTDPANKKSSAAAVPLAAAPEDYDYTGRSLTQITDEASTNVGYTWCDGCGAIKEVDEPMSRSLSWTRDDDRQVTAFTDARGNTTNYIYGSAGELKEIDYPDPDPDSSYIQFKRYNSGLVREMRNVYTGSRTQFGYNAARQLTGITPYHEPQITFTYDSDGRLSEIGDQSGDFTYTYTDSSLLESETDDLSGLGLSNDQVIEYEYYPDQLLKKVTWKDGTTTVADWTYEYDGAGRVTKITNSFSEETDFTYDDGGKLTLQENDNGTSTAYTYYQERGWPTQITHDDGSGTFEEYDIEYDGGTETVGLITQVDEDDGSSIEYGYDALYRLTSETRTGTQAYSQTLGYDLAGNITTVNSSTYATYNEANEITSLTGGTVNVALQGVQWGLGLSGSTFVSHGHDKFDNQVRQTQGSTNRYLTYDHDGTLRHIEEPGGDDIVMLYAGGKLIAELKNGSPYKAYTWGPAGPVSMRILTGTPVSYWYHLGPQGETRHLTNSSGTTVASYYYKAYGELLSSVPSIDNPFQYGARFGYYQLSDFNREIRIGNRMYSPAIMRWYTRDLYNYRGGDNLYRYAEDNPLRYYDDGGEIPEHILMYDESWPNNNFYVKKYKPKSFNYDIYNNPESFTVYCRANGDEVYVPIPGKPSEFGFYNGDQYGELLLNPGNSPEGQNLKQKFDQAKYISVFCETCDRESFKQFTDKLANKTGKTVLYTTIPSGRP